MAAGYFIGDEFELPVEELRLEEPPTSVVEFPKVTQDDFPMPPSPLRPSLRLSRSSSISFKRPPSRSFASTSSLSVPGLTAASTSTSTLRSDNSSWDGVESSIYDESASSDTELEDTDNSISRAIPTPCRGVHFHARRKQFVIIPAPQSSAPRIVSVQFQGNKVREITSRKPFGASMPSFSHQDICLSARGPDHVAVVRRNAKTNKVFLTIHRRENDKASHLPTQHPAQLLHDLSPNADASAALLTMHDSALYMVGNQKYDHVWRLDFSEPSKGLHWTRDEHKTFPRPNTKPVHHTGSPRIGFTWNNSIIVIGVEVVTKKRASVQTPYASPKPKSSQRKEKKAPTPASSSPNALCALNIWQYSMLNHTWSRRTATTPAPQGEGSPWPLSLSGCLVGEDVACISLGRPGGTCVWALDLHTWNWTELTGVLPRDCKVYAMSAVGTTLYFMGDELAPNSPIVHCDMSIYSPWSHSSRNPEGRLQSFIFPDSKPPTEPPSPVDETTPLLEVSPEPRTTLVTHTNISASVLPSYGTAPSPLSPTAATILFFTPYRILHEARDDSQFEKIRNALASEWATCAMTLMGFVAIDAAVLGLSRDGTIIPVDDIAIKAVAVSILCALIGVCFTCWLYIIYYSQDGETFRMRTRDTLNTYMFFAIRSRIPMLCVAVTLTSFGVFVYHCLMQVAPDVVLPIFAISGILLGLNMFVYIYYTLRWVVMRIVGGFKWLFGIGRRSEVAQVSQLAAEAVMAQVGEKPIVLAQAGERVVL